LKKTFLMNPGTLLNPGIRLLRRLQLGGKLAWLAVLSALPPLLVVLQFALASRPAEGLATLAMACGLILCLLVYFLLAFRCVMADGIDQLAMATGKMVAGDLRLEPAGRGADELGRLLASTAALSHTLSGMVANVRSNAAFVAHSGQSMARGNRELSDRTEQQAANLEQTAASVEQLSSTVRDNAGRAGQANLQAAQVRDLAEAGAAAMTEAVASVEAIHGGAKRMDEIVGVIDGLAFQTNILALNAAVEAARAGESGRGFAVVAAEVRSLAKRSAESAKEIRQLIGESSRQVEASVQTIRTAGSSITHMVSGIRDVAANMAQISKSSTEQSASLGEITTAVRQLDKITQDNAQMVERAVAQATRLEGRASTLVQSVAGFRLQQGSAEEACAMVGRAIAHGRNMPRDVFLRDLTNSAKGFHDRDMYVFALDSRGTYLAFGGNPAKLGTRVQDIPGIDGQGLLEAIVSQASEEPGWVEYDITNPATGKVQTKMSFVQQAGDIFVGCGVYKNIVSA
jgi:methyl-accepting chemotaxis protein